MERIMNNTYPITKPLALPERANPRFADLTTKESERGGRVIGGDMADLRFLGYTLRDDTTVLDCPELVTVVDLRGRKNPYTDEDLHSLAVQILSESYASIGIECVEHS
jgi:hypothetical protein